MFGSRMRGGCGWSRGHRGTGDINALQTDRDVLYNYAVSGGTQGISV